MAASVTDAAVVFIGGGVGAVARWLVGQAFPTVEGQWPLPTFAINVAGALVLGLVTGWLAGSLDPRAPRFSLLVGTGLLGGFTTFSTFSVETVALWRTSPLLGLGYATGSVIAGVAGAAGGWWLAS